MLVPNLRRSESAEINFHIASEFSLHRDAFRVKSTKKFAVRLEIFFLFLHSPFVTSVGSSALELSVGAKAREEKEEKEEFVRVSQSVFSETVGQ